MSSTQFHLWFPPCPGSQSLRYNLPVVTQDGSVQSRFLAEEQLDGQPFLHYDCEEGSAESQGWWADAVLGAVVWDTHIKDLVENGKDFRITGRNHGPIGQERR